MPALGWLLNLDFAGSATTAAAAVRGPFSVAAAEAFAPGAVAGEAAAHGATAGDVCTPGTVARETSA